MKNTKSNDTMPHLSDMRVQENICYALEQVPIANCSGIKVFVVEGIVTLKGKVDEGLMINIVKEWVEYVPGVSDVLNELHIDSSKPDEASVLE